MDSSRVGTESNEAPSLREQESHNSERHDPDDRGRGASKPRDERRCKEERRREADRQQARVVERNVVRVGGRIFSGSIYRSARVADAFLDIETTVQRASSAGRCGMGGYVSFIER